MTLHKSFPIALLALVAFLIFLSCMFLTFIGFLTVANIRSDHGLANAAQVTATVAPAASFARPAAPQGVMFKNRIVIGRGTIQNVTWASDDTTLAATGSAGTWLYSSTFRDIGYLPEARLGRFSPDGKWLAGVDQENRITLWDATSWRLVTVLVGHDMRVRLLRWSADSQIAGISNNGTIWIWDANTGAVKTQLTFDGNPYTADLLWGPDGKSLFRSTIFGEFFDGQKLTKLDITTGKILFETTFRAGGGALHLSPDKTILAVVGQNIELVDVATGQTIKSLIAHAPADYLAFMSSMSWSADGRKIASGDINWDRDRTQGAIYIWDVATGNQLGKLSSGGQGIVNLAWNASGNTLLSFDRDNILQTWDVGAMRLLSTLDSHSYIGGLVTWKTDWSKVAATDGNVIARVWDTTTGQQTSTLSGHHKPITTMTWKPGNPNILTTSSGEHYSYLGASEAPRLWDADKGIMLEAVRGVNWGFELGEVSSIVWSADGSRLFMTNYDGRLMVWNLASKALERNVKQNEGSTAANAQLAPGGQKVTVKFSWSGGACLSIWNWVEGTKDAGCVSSGGFGGCGGGGNYQYTDAWTPDGKRFLTASWRDFGPNTSLVPLDESYLKIYLETVYDERDSREKPTKKSFELSHIVPIRFVSWSTDREFFLSFSDDNLIRIWSTATGELLTKLAANAIRKVSWSPKDDSFVTIDDRGNALLWRRLAGAEGFAWESSILTNDVDSAVWHPDGQAIVVTSTRDNRLRVVDTQGRLQDQFAGIGGDPVWSPDGRRLSQTTEGMIVIWSQQTK